MFAALLGGARPTPGQQSFLGRVRGQNTAMTAVQPGWLTPLVEADPRLVQYTRWSFSNEYTPLRTETTSYGNARGTGFIIGNRYELDIAQPTYVQHNGASTDGFGDTGTQGKVRIVSGNGDHGNYILTAMVNHTFATGSHSNGALTDTWAPTLAGGVGVGKRFALESALGGVMPTGKIATQGRSIGWNSLVQARLAGPVRVEFEDNATVYFAGSHDGKMQNFVTPAAFYILRLKSWKPTRPFYIFDSGMQIATSGFHTYNHNLISEVRILF
jgi:hypothetical protein